MQTSNQIRSHQALYPADVSVSYKRSNLSQRVLNKLNPIHQKKAAKLVRQVKSELTPHLKRVALLDRLFKLDRSAGKHFVRTQLPTHLPKLAMQEALELVAFLFQAGFTKMSDTHLIINLLNNQIQHQNACSVEEILSACQTVLDAFEPSAFVGLASDRVSIRFQLSNDFVVNSDSQQRSECNEIEIALPENFNDQDRAFLVSAYGSYPQKSVGEALWFDLSSQDYHEGVKQPKMSNVFYAQALNYLSQRDDDRLALTEEQSRLLQNALTTIDSESGQTDLLMLTHTLLLRNENGDSLSLSDTSNTFNRLEENIFINTLNSCSMDEQVRFVVEQDCSELKALGWRCLFDIVVMDRGPSARERMIALGDAMSRGLSYSDMENRFMDWMLEGPCGVDQNVLMIETLCGASPAKHYVSVIETLCGVSSAKHQVGQALLSRLQASGSGSNGLSNVARVLVAMNQLDLITDRNLKKFCVDSDNNDYSINAKYVSAGRLPVCLELLKALKNSSGFDRVIAEAGIELLDRLLCTYIRSADYDNPSAIKPITHLGENSRADYCETVLGTLDGIKKGGICDIDHLKGLLMRSAWRCRTDRVTNRAVSIAAQQGLYEVAQKLRDDRKKLSQIDAHLRCITPKKIRFNRSFTNEISRVNTYSQPSHTNYSSHISSQSRPACDPLRDVVVYNAILDC